LLPRSLQQARQQGSPWALAPALVLRLRLVQERQREPQQEPPPEWWPRRLSARHTIP